MKYQRLILSLFIAVLAVLITANAAQSEDLKPEIADALASGDTARAITAINKEIELDPSYHVNYYTLGQIDYKREQFRKALEQFTLALDKKSKHYESLYYQALCQLKLGRLDEAEAGMKKGLSKARDLKTQFQNGYGQVLLAKEEYDESLRYLLQAVNEDTANAEYHINVGDAYYYMGVPYSAVTEYEKALALDTAGTEVYFHWAEACLGMQDFTCALEKLRIVLVKDSTYVPAWRRAGEIYFKAAMSARTRSDREGRFRDAIGAYRKFVSLSGVVPDSESVRVYFELGMAYVDVNGFESAVEEFDKVLAIPYEPKDIYFYYGKALTRTRDYVKAAEMLQKHVDWVAKQGEGYNSRVRDWELYQLLGDCYFYRESKDFYTAVQNYKKSLADNPDQKRLIQNVAIGLDRQGNYREALKYYDERIKLGIDSSNSALFKYAAYSALNQANAAEGGGDDEMLEDELEGESEAAPVVDTVDYNLLGAQYFEKYIEFNPTDADVIERIATTYYHGLNSCEMGVKWYQKLAEANPSSCESSKWLGFAYFGGLCTKNYSKALGYLSKAYDCQNAAGKTDIDLMMWIAQAHHLLAVDISTSDPAGSKKEYKLAYDWYNKVLKVDASSAEAKKGVEQTAYEY